MEHQSESSHQTMATMNKDTIMLPLLSTIHWQSLYIRKLDEKIHKLENLLASTSSQIELMRTQFYQFSKQTARIELIAKQRNEYLQMCLVKSYVWFDAKQCNEHIGKYLTPQNIEITRRKQMFYAGIIDPAQYLHFNHASRTINETISNNMNLSNRLRISSKVTKKSQHIDCKVLQLGTEPSKLLNTKQGDLSQTKLSSANSTKRFIFS